MRLSSLRTLAFPVILTAVGAGWLADHRALADKAAQAENKADQIETKFNRAKSTILLMDHKAHRIDHDKLFE
jgi:hypothetical protein